ncbi:succinate dehydrogenase hydrophobic membrane anchor subunit [Cellulomonas bogoriensis]|uniref:Succinate dehydrogenase n=1 Tax=Cellulomonas bogoriensis 69B4 = DSM 16987 TaxID=1386082 RepID=A0A0A0C089_9CELL|nr:succinate dehydrogenase hydrophobic membrane anchor subunit [Cellulomonas bogoriensis]KGM13347.1 succinate dehydrogenase [Cellulomonas bogoriensis 69B4 = DSM 16987]
MAATAPDIAAPRAPRNRRTTRTNWELYGWLFMRASGVLLLILIFGHLFVNLMTGDGIQQIDFAFVAGKLSSPFWQTWDLLMLWLAMIHGTNGVRTIINDYAERIGTRVVLKSALYLAFTITVTLGTLVIFTFDPCPPGSPDDLLPALCFD